MRFKIKIIENFDDLKSKSLNISDLKSKSNHDFDFNPFGTDGYSSNHLHFFPISNKVSLPDASFPCWHLQ